MIAPAFEKPLCVCDGCMDWARLELSRSNYAYHAGLGEGAYWNTDLLDDFFTVVARWRKVRVAYLAHVEYQREVAMAA